MIPRIEIATAQIPGEEARLRLLQRGAEYSIMLGGNELMNSRLSGSEEVLATRSIEQLEGRLGPELLIGGLGMGFTLRAALGALDMDARVTVVELVPAVVQWARGPLAGVFEGSLDDMRVHMVEADVVDVISATRRGYDAILLDVDNGPDGLTRGSNDRLYGAAGLRAAHAALKAGGVLAVWSAAAEPRFARRLRDAGFAVQTHIARANRDKGARHTIWIATAI